MSDPARRIGSRTARLRRCSRDWLLLPALLVYLAALVLAAIPREIQPHWLGPPHALAVRLLDLAGIEPGIVVFHDPEGADEKWRAICVKVRGRDAAGASVDLYPPGGACDRWGFRFRLPPVHLAISNMLEQARAHEREWQHGRDREGHRDSEQAVLGSLGRHFCAASWRAGRPLAEVSVAWYVVAVSYRRGNEWILPHLVFRWSCDAALLRDARWYPDEPATIAFWGGRPWE